MAHIELRELTEQDRDAAYRAARTSTSSRLRPHIGDRATFDTWCDALSDAGTAALWAIFDEALVVGLAAGFDAHGEREIVWALSPEAAPGIATAALRLLLSREAERPLYAATAADDDPSRTALAALGFVESHRTADEVVSVLPPTLE